VVVTIDVELEQRIAELVAARRPVLEQLLREAVDRELVALVDQLDAALELLASSDGTPAPPTASETEVPVALCSRCDSEPRLPDRKLGRACYAERQRARRRERKAASSAVQEGPSDDEARPADHPAALHVSIAERGEAVAELAADRRANGSVGITAAELLERGVDDMVRAEAKWIAEYLAPLKGATITGSDSGAERSRGVRVRNQSGSTPRPRSNRP
jgi:hypothetical protein